MSRLAESIDIRSWTHQLDSPGRDLLNGQITALAWQDGMDDLFRNIDPDPLVRSINFEQATKNSTFDFIDQNKNFTPVRFLPHTGAPENKK